MFKLIDIESASVYYKLKCQFRKFFIIITAHQWVIIIANATTLQETRSKSSNKKNCSWLKCQQVRISSKQIKEQGELSSSLIFCREDKQLAPIKMIRVLQAAVKLLVVLALDPQLLKPHMLSKVNNYKRENIKLYKILKEISIIVQLQKRNK